MANDLNLTVIADGQADDQWQSSNDGLTQLANAMADIYTVDFTAGNVTLTAAQFRSANIFIGSNLSATRVLTLPAVKRPFWVYNPDAVDTITVTKGATTVSVGPLKLALCYTDGTADGLVGAAITAGAVASNPTESLIIAVGDETTAITTGTAKVTFRMPYAFTLSAVRASLTTVSSSGTPTIDINEAGTTILSTKLTIDASEKTSTTAATPAVISDTALADDAEITIDIDVAGTGAAGLKVYLIGVRA
ncbi:MAG: hypothetical protein E5Y73_11225 [Mesorhizobium sp.]|uniref:hypothetical protein n=1 Tax=Mesorhizobium sp. TaxID=1871066 RepID=UPI0011F77CC0|nr:hypothetical protein [Mesorhizobium sp.]TIL94671.1 MAG: hypothetical protein E5Y73_11225 [Mesorhizobium sp.]